MFRHNIVYVATLLTSPNVRSTDLLHGLNILIVAVHAAPQSFNPNRSLEILPYIMFR